MTQLGVLLEKLGRKAGLSQEDLLALRQKGNNIEGNLAIFTPPGRGIYPRL